jgi:hypothetical protein
MERRGRNKVRIGRMVNDNRKEGNTDAKVLKARKNVAAQKGLKEIVSQECKQYQMSAGTLTACKQFVR